MISKNGVKKVKTLVIIAHPEVKDSNSQQFLIDSSQKLDNVTTHILKEEEINVKKEQALLLEYDRIIFQFPMYWYSAPYLLKKWIDSVFDDVLLKGGLKDKELGLIVTLGLSEEAFATGRSENYTLSELFRPFEALANKCGMTYLPIFAVSLFSYMEEIQKKELLISYQQYLTKENSYQFKSKEEWFTQRLMKYSEDENRPNQNQLSLILEGIKDNRDSLEDLLILVNEMREFND